MANTKKQIKPSVALQDSEQAGVNPFENYYGENTFSEEYYIHQEEKPLTEMEEAELAKNDPIYEKYRQYRYLCLGDAQILDKLKVLESICTLLEGKINHSLYKHYEVWRQELEEYENSILLKTDKLIAGYDWYKLCPYHHFLLWRSLFALRKNRQNDGRWKNQRLRLFVKSFILAIVLIFMIKMLISTVSCVCYSHDYEKELRRITKQEWTIDEEGSIILGEYKAVEAHVARRPKHVWWCELKSYKTKKEELKSKISQYHNFAEQWFKCYKQIHDTPNSLEIIKSKLDQFRQSTQNKDIFNTSPEHQKKIHILVRSAIFV